MVQIRNRITFLFGAGASSDPGYIHPKAPPLMRELFDELADAYPTEWGDTSSRWIHRSRFQSRFEEAFSELVLNRHTDGRPWFAPPSPLTLLENQWQLALYFARFRLNGDGQDCYSELLRGLKQSSKIRQTTFASLNYDCLLEQAALSMGLQVDYHASADLPEGVVRVLKLHGSCNFVTRVQNARDAQSMKALLTSSTAVEMPMKELSVVHLDAALEDAKRSGTFPVMSQVSAYKETVTAMVGVHAIRERWREAASSADCVVVVGVSYNAHDRHVIDTVENAQQAIYIGGSQDFTKWSALNPCVVHLGERFRTSLPELLKCL